ncbi:hypothetical protein GW796_10100 [archaeon]|nr:hypothetical protein [archaeon]
MKIVPRNEIYGFSENKNNQSLWEFVSSEEAKHLLLDDDEQNMKDWTKKINYNHHNTIGFFANFKNIFKVDGKFEFLAGQEDIGAIQLEKEVVIVRHTDMGVSLSIYSPNINELIKKEWNNVEKILYALDIGFVSAKDFHSLNEFDKLNKELANNNLLKQKKFKL